MRYYSPFSPDSYLRTLFAPAFFLCCCFAVQAQSPASKPPSPPQPSVRALSPAKSSIQPSIPRKAVSTARIAVNMPTERRTLLLLRFRQLQEVIQMLEWAVDRGWLENLDIDQLKQVDQWLRGRFATMLGIQWERGIWLHVQGTNQTIQPMTAWPNWLPAGYARTWRAYLNKLQQLEITLQIPIQKTFWMAFAIQQILGLAKVPFYTSNYNNTQSYWLFPPQGIPAIMIFQPRYIYVRLLWPHPSIHQESGRLALWKRLIVPSLVTPGQSLELAQKRTKTSLSQQSTMAAYIAVSDVFRWLQALPSRTLRSLREQFSHIDAIGWEGTLTLSSFSSKTIEWHQKRATWAHQTYYPWSVAYTRMWSSPSTSAVPGPRNQQAPTGRNKKSLPSAKPQPTQGTLVPQGAPQGLPLPNPLWRRSKPNPPNIRRDPFVRGAPVSVSGDDGTKGPVPSTAKRGATSVGMEANQVHAPVSRLPLLFVTWPSERTVFFGSFSQSRTSIQPRSVLIRRLFRNDQQEVQQKDVWQQLLQRIQQTGSSVWGAQDLWWDHRQLALWLLESMMFREWMLWGELESTSVPALRTNSPADTQPAVPGHKAPAETKPTHVSLGGRTKYVRIAAVGRWNAWSRSWLVSILTPLATQITHQGRKIRLHFFLGPNRPMLLLTWRDDLWFLSDSPKLLERMLTLYQRKERGTFLDKLPTDSMVYHLQQDRQWNVLYLNPASLQCLMQRSLTGQIAGLLTQKVESVEISTRPQPMMYEIQLQVRWNVDKKPEELVACVPPAKTWKHIIPLILAPFQHAFFWQFLEHGSRHLPAPITTSW